MPKGIPLTEEEQARRRSEIIETAVGLFMKKGFTETSMREIAEAAGLGKSTLYDYFQTKEEILVVYFEEKIRAISDEAERINQKNLPAEDKLRQVMQKYLEYMYASKEDYLKLTAEVQRLGQQSQLRIQASRHAHQDLMCRLVEAGIREGSFRPVDPMLAMRVTLSALTSVVFTSRPSGTPQEMLESALDILLRGIQA